ncbi:MAG: hypothetical protein AMS27_00565 [Bacteroides sp. SM23_62_1]|nr:MAG: hypothetical protein AMS27_00565 [Bacteroides sp. SM23_62_1]
MQIKRFILGFLIFIIPVFPVYSQTRKARKAIKKSERVEENSNRTYERGRKDAIKQRYKIQTNEVQKRMKQSKKKADRYNKANRQPFYKDLFDRKKKHKRRKR